MNKNVKARITGDGVKGFFDRAREHTRKLDRGEEVAPEITVSSENASDEKNPGHGKRRIVESRAAKY
jgi:hypothetical protein